jgi:hypothetical protein
MRQCAPLGAAEFVQAAEAAEKLLGAVVSPFTFLAIHQAMKEPQEENDRYEHAHAGNDQRWIKLFVIDAEIAPHLAPVVRFSE